MRLCDVLLPLEGLLVFLSCVLSSGLLDRVPGLVSAAGLLGVVEKARRALGWRTCRQVWQIKGANALAALGVAMMCRRDLRAAEVRETFARGERRRRLAH